MARGTIANVSPLNGASTGSGEAKELRDGGTALRGLDVQQAVRNVNGGLLGFSKITRDITERVQNEKKIARLSRIQAVRTGINSAIIRIREREPLFSGRGGDHRG